MCVTLQCIQTGPALTENGDAVDLNAKGDGLVKDFCHLEHVGRIHALERRDHGRKFP